MNSRKTILIIGGTSDIGNAVARKFACKGFNIQLAGRNIQNVKLISKDIEIRYQVQATFYELDILKFDSFKTFLSNLSILPDVVVCATGLLGNQENDEKNIFASKVIMNTNFIGPSLLLGEVAELFKNRGYGTIIGISSVAGDRGRGSNYIYGSSKSGFTSFLSGLRNKLSPDGVDVITVKPGFVRTKMTAHLQLPGLLTSNVEEVANTIFHGYSKNKEVIYVKKIWLLIMFVIKLIPENIFKKLNF